MDPASTGGVIFKQSLIGNGSALLPGPSRGTAFAPIARGLLIAILIPLSFLSTASASELEEGCTIGVAAGKATADGRPLLWKTRDYAPRPNNEVYYNTSFKYKFVSVVNAGMSYVRMGVNEKGFAIVNSTSYDLPGGSSGFVNGSLMRYALGTCATVEEFEQLLDSTNVTGRQTQANFGVIDTTGAAAIFETGGNVYWRFDAGDTIQAPNGYVLRTNFAINGGGSSGIERYNRTVQLIADFYAGDSLNYKSIARYQMRDFSDSDSDPVSVPYPYSWSPSSPFGYIYTRWSICRSSSVSAAVIQGVLPEEPARLSTMWTMLGQPASSIVVPYWPVGATPPESNGFPTAPLCDVANQIKTLLFDYEPDTIFIDSYKLRDGYDGGLWAHTFPAEDSVLAAAEEKLVLWRTAPPMPQEMLATESDLASYALGILERGYTGLLSTEKPGITATIPHSFALEQNYPNPFNSATVIQFDLPRRSDVSLVVFDLLGREIATLINRDMYAGGYRSTWDGTDDRGQAVSSGVYIYRLESAGQVQTKKLILVK